MNMWVTAVSDPAEGPESESSTMAGCLSAVVLVNEHIIE